MPHPNAAPTNLHDPIYSTVELRASNARAFRQGLDVALQTVRRVADEGKDGAACVAELQALLQRL